MHVGDIPTKPAISVGNAVAMTFDKDLMYTMYKASGDEHYAAGTQVMNVSISSYRLIYSGQLLILTMPHHLGSRIGASWKITMGR